MTKEEIFLTTEPKTAADLLALPIRDGIQWIERIVDGQKFLVPRSYVIKSFWVDDRENSVHRATDEKGKRWALCKDDKGWFRKAVL